MKANTLKKNEILRGQKSIRSVLRNGNRVRGKYITLYFLESEKKRFAVFVRKVSGGAVQRNKIKRWIREIYRKNKSEISGIFDIIIISEKPCSEIIFSEIETETKDLLKRIK